MFQTNKGCLCKLILPCTMGLYGSPYDCTIHVALIAIPHESEASTFTVVVLANSYLCLYKYADTDTLMPYAIGINSHQVGSLGV